MAEEWATETDCYNDPPNALQIKHPLCYAQNSPWLPGWPHWTFRRICGGGRYTFPLLIMDRGQK